MSNSWRNMRERGNRPTLALMKWLALHIPRKLILPIVYIVAFYYWLTAPAARRASKKFLGRSLDRRPRWYDSYRHIVHFAIIMVDRILFLTGRAYRFSVTVRGAELFESRVRQGGILVTAHMGSFDVMRVMGASQLTRPLHILLDVQHNRWTMAMIRKLDPQLAANIIDASDSGPALALRVQEKVANGGLVGIMADRCGVAEEARVRSFLGHPARFPIGPWRIAGVLRTPVVACFGLYEGGNRYSLNFELIAEDMGGSRQQREQWVGEAVDRYCAILETYARHYPLNWFNFYDFWDDDTVNDY